MTSPPGISADVMSVAQVMPRVEVRDFSKQCGVFFETIAAFAFGAALMAFVYVDHRGVPYEQIGIPGYDSWYHTKMAVLLPQIGFPREFPWLKFVYFRDHSDNFVSHHTGFHVLLAPFVHLGKYVKGDFLPGARWAMIFFFGLLTALMDSLLRSGHIRWRWLWLALFTLCGADFFLRHSYIRAICPSLCFMLILLNCLFRAWYIRTGLFVALYIHLYLGGVIYGPIIVAAFAVATFLTGEGGRRFEWRLIGVTGGAWCLGILTHPYVGGILEFLRLQVLGSGLTPDIEVGNEWQSYGNVWGLFSEQLGGVGLVWCLALILRFASREPVGRKEITLLLLSFLFLALTFKAKRFIEYSPVFFIVCSAFLAKPVINRIAEWENAQEAAGSVPRLWRLALLVAVPVLALVCMIGYVDQQEIKPVVQQVPLITIVTLLAVLSPLLRTWTSSWRQIAGATACTIAIIAIPLSGALLKAGLELGFGAFFEMPSRASNQIPIGYTVTGFVSLVFILATVLVAWCLRGRWRDEPRPIALPLIQNLFVLMLAIPLTLLVVAFSGPRLARAQRMSWCGYDLPAIGEMMSYVKDISLEGDLIFTDDWDVFPVFFYFNSYNHYAVGLDPKFTQNRKPELWERYTRITRGQTPFHDRIKVRNDKGELVERDISVHLDDILTHFGAQVVIADHDHLAFARQLLSRSDLVTVVYPASGKLLTPDAPFVVFTLPDRQP